MMKAAMITVIVSLSTLMAHPGDVTRAADTIAPASMTEKQATGQPAAGPLSKDMQAELRKQCADDAKRFCHNVIPGGGRILRCLEARTADLSEGCRQGLAQINK